MSASRTKLVLDEQASRDRLVVEATFDADPALDLAALPLAVRVSDATGTIFERFLPAGALVPNGDGARVPLPRPERCARSEGRPPVDPPLERRPDAAHAEAARPAPRRPGRARVALPAVRVEVAAATEAYAANAACTAGTHRAVCATP